MDACDNAAHFGGVAEGLGTAILPVTLGTHAKQKKVAERFQPDPACFIGTGF